MSTIQSASQRELELELIRVRAEARAARLEAQAAELELMLRRMSPEFQPGPWPESEKHLHPGHTEVRQPLGAIEPARPHTATVHGSWEQRLERMQSRHQPVAAPENSEFQPRPGIQWESGQIDLAQLLKGTAGATSSALDSPVSDAAKPSEPVSDIHRSDSAANQDEPSEVTPRLRIDPPHEAPAPKHLANDKLAEPTVKPAISSVTEKRRPNIKPVAKAATPVVAPEIAVAPEMAEVAAAAAKVASENDDEQPTRWRPASWMLSTVAHLVVLIVLASMSLAVSPPKDQLAFSGSSGDSDEAVIENFQIETSEPVAPSEPTEAETAYDVSELGTLPVTEVNVDLPAMVTPDTEIFSDLTSSSAPSSSMMKSLKGEQGPKTQFCGVDGGGKHFVYLVDSSNSMGSGFQSARAELLASIDQLKPDQRFYVVFFDEQPDYMRVNDPNVDDDASVMATPENKKLLRSWAMNVEMNKGKAPYDVLPFVLKLRPDVIFLLSDGEFPDKIGQILREQNRQENLFGDNGPISIVHTIRYHGREGEEGRRAESTMVAIAKENSGQYRHVPKPKSN